MNDINSGFCFLFQSEAPLMIRPFLKDMTKSELHAVCTGGFATIAGAVMAAYILMKVNVMSKYQPMLYRTLHSCSCIIEFMKRVEGKGY